MRWSELPPQERLEVASWVEFAITILASCVLVGILIWWWKRWTRL